MKTNPERIEEALLRVNSTLASEIPVNQLGYIILQCNTCYTPYKTQLVGLVSPNTEGRAFCPNCRNKDTHIVYDSITFDSNFEKECYILLKKYNISSIKHSVYYKDIFPTNRKWVCDFFLDNSLILEVSSFKSDFKGYFSNMEDKRKAAMENNVQFEFFQSIKELKDFLDIRYSLNVY